ncbi:substrate-binding domain-containing protein [Pseudosulfitobacter sp. SM2401]|uniref:LacI family DNA-binding transcriptional regulator n=1 Tax=Pseudosulfitobacter sp. SM2401 TaxID=3350098 RepID=UPI0036F28382
MSEINSKNADIVAVAKAARVSISTVSRSFNHPELVKPATRKKIDTAVRKLGYIRNRAAQTMHGIRSGTIGLVVPTIDHAIFAEVIQAFSDAVEGHGFTILVASHGYNLEREYSVLRKFLEHRVDGVALIGLDHSDETYNLVKRQGIPAITVWNYDAQSVLPCVGADNRQAGAIAAQHVVDLGHRKVALVFPPTKDNDRARDRLTGAQSVLETAGVQTPDGASIETLYSISDAKRVVTEMLNNAPALTAILCGNDVLAVGALYAARQCGLRVPHDISIIGIGDFKGSKEMEPALTTVRLPARRIGHLAGEQLAQSIVQQSKDTTRTSCEIELVDRQTCSTPRQTTL